MENNESGLTISDPEEELYKVYLARIKPFSELENVDKLKQYEKAWEIAREHVRKTHLEDGAHAS